tara:strand:- start:898 stop:1191 length:294 start_codon:yes stop_codon:yes gene_type:complete
VGKTIEQAERWKEDTDEIELQFMHLVNLSTGLGIEWLKKQTKRMYKELMEDDVWTYRECIIFEHRGYDKSFYRSDHYLNTHMAVNNFVGQPVGLLDH